MARNLSRLKRFARANRSAMNDAETRLWFEIRRRQLGYRFRRQYVIGSYIVDFVCLRLRLVIEIDGSQHRNSAYDRRRDEYLESCGYTVVRVWSWDVLRDIEGVLQEIHSAIDLLDPSPPAF